MSKLFTTARHPSANDSGLAFKGPRRAKPVKVGSPAATPEPMKTFAPMSVHPPAKVAKWEPNPQAIMRKFKPL